MTIACRKLGAGSAAQYREIRLESLKAYPDAFGSGYEAQRALPKLMFEKALEDAVDDRFMMGAFDDEELIGICGFVMEAVEKARSGEIIQMYLRPAYSGQKIGLKLVEAVIEEAFGKWGIEQIVLGVRQDNVRAVRIYEQAGFVKYEAGKDIAEDIQEGFQRMILLVDERSARKQ